MSLLGSTGEADEYRRWSATRGYRVELAALIHAQESGHMTPTTTDYRQATQIVDALALPACYADSGPERDSPSDAR